MKHTPKQWTLEGFVEHFEFVHKKMLDHKFAWVLGAGASLASGVPLGSTLVDRWLSELHIREEDADKRTPIEKWATEENLDIKGFTFAKRANFYPKIYERRFRDYPDEGYAYLEDAMASADPSPGYSILAAALAGNPPEHPSRHNAVVTTNFDNLVADALSIYTDTFPFVCGHESLAPFVRVAMRRPVVCKIHRDLLLAPQNDPRSLKRLHDAWGMALRGLFEHYTPLFIGYGGNDDTLMDLLGSVEPGEIKGQMVWCYHERGEPSERICNLVADHDGILVPVPDFDLLMVLLGEKMEIELMDEEIGQRADRRTEEYRNRIQRLDTVAHPEVTKALAATLHRSGGWWTWEQKAKSEPDPERSEVVYRQGIQHCPQSAELHGNFAVFMTDMRKKYDEAETLYRKAIELDPKNAINFGNFAGFMTDVRGEHGEAEKLYRKANELDSKNSNNVGNFAIFMTVIRGNHDDAERLFQRAIELAPKDAGNVRNFAVFMTKVRGEHDEAERLFRNAIELDPKNAANVGKFAKFMTDVRGEHDEAERLFRNAIELDPKNIANISNFAKFVTDVRGEHDEAERLFRKAIKLDPKNTGSTGNFANFLTDVRGEHDEAERLYRKAIELDPKNIANTGNYAKFLTDVRGDHGEAERLYRKAITLDPKNATSSGNFGALLLAQDRPKDATVKLDEAELLNGKRTNQLAAEIALYRLILSCIEKMDDIQAVSNFRRILTTGFNRDPWNFDQVLNYAKKHVSVRDHALFTSLAEAILDAEKVDAALTLLDQRSPSGTKSKAGTKRSPKRAATKGKNAKKTASKKKPAAKQSKSKKARRKKA